MRTIQKIAGAAAATALIMGGASIAFAQTTGSASGASSSYNPSAQIVPATPNTSPSSASGSSSGSATGSATTRTSTSSATPGVPNTGAGGDLGTNAAVLGTSAAIALMGGAYLLRRRFA